MSIQPYSTWHFNEDCIDVLTDVSGKRHFSIVIDNLKVSNILEEAYYKPDKLMFHNGMLTTVCGVHKNMKQAITNYIQKVKNDRSQMYSCGIEYISIAKKCSAGLLIYWDGDLICTGKKQALSFLRTYSHEYKLVLEL